MKTIITLFTLTFTLLLGLAPAARAGYILQPVAATSTGGGAPNNLRNQSGLSTGYTTGDDFDAYIASNPTHDSSIVANRWTSAGFTNAFSTLTFDLGGTYTIESFALWNAGFLDNASVRIFDLVAADDASFSSPTTFLNDQVANINGVGPAAAVLPEVFTFTPTSAAFVRLVIVANNGAAKSRFGEVAFEVHTEAVPEPSSLALLGLGVVGLAGAAWRRRRARKQAA